MYIRQNTSDDMVVKNRCGGYRIGYRSRVGTPSLGASESRDSVHGWASVSDFWNEHGRLPGMAPMDVTRLSEDNDGDNRLVDGSRATPRP